MSEQNRSETFDGSEALVPVEPRRPRRHAGVAHHAALTRALGDALRLYVRFEEKERALALLGDKPHKHALVQGYWVTGARTSELLAAFVRHLDFTTRAISIQTLKRRQEHWRVIPLPPDYLGELAVLINQKKLTPEARLYPWSRSRAYEIVNQALMAAGVEKARATPRALRHGHAVHALLNGVPLNVVQEALGHASAVTTSVYVRVIGRDIRDYYEDVEW